MLSKQPCLSNEKIKKECMKSQLTFIQIHKTKDSWTLFAYIFSFCLNSKKMSTNFATVVLWTLTFSMDVTGLARKMTCILVGRLWYLMNCVLKTPFNWILTPVIWKVKDNILSSKIKSDYFMVIFFSIKVRL